MSSVRIILSLLLGLSLLSIPKALSVAEALTDFAPEPSPTPDVPLYCGDGILDFPQEECDDGNNQDFDSCSSSCRNEICGDGIIQSNLGESCDDKNIISGDGCDLACNIEANENLENQGNVCGNSAIEPPAEQCDDGNCDDGDGCSSTCQVE